MRTYTLERLPDYDLDDGRGPREVIALWTWYEEPWSPGAEPQNSSLFETIEEAYRYIHLNRIRPLKDNT